MTDSEKQTSSNTNPIYGYGGKVIRVDLTKKESAIETLEESLLRKIGIRFIIYQFQLSRILNHLI